jgi:hypothetical protein
VVFDQNTAVMGKKGGSICSARARGHPLSTTHTSSRYVLSIVCTRPKVSNIIHHPAMTISHAAKEMGKWCDAKTGVEGSSGVSESTREVLSVYAHLRPSSIVRRPSSVVHRPSSIVHRPSSIVHRLSQPLNCADANVPYLFLQKY